MKPFSIRKKLIVAFILVGVFPMLLATYIGVKIAAGRLETGIEERISYAGKSAVFLLDKKKTELEGVARSFSEDARLRKVIQGGVNIKFLWFDTPLQVYLFNHENAMIFSSTGESFDRPRNPEQGMTLLRVGDQGKSRALLVYLFPVSEGDRPVGTIVTGYPLGRDFLNDLKSVTGVETLLFEETGGAYDLPDGTGRLRIPPEVLEDVTAARRQAFTKEAAVVREGTEEAYLALLTPLPDAEGRVSYLLFNGIPRSETLTGKLASARFYYILIVLGVLLSVLAGSAVATGISWPILRFSEGVRAIGAGDYNQKIRLRSRDEIGELAESFNRMTDRLRETIAELVENRNYTENILRSLLNGVISIDREFRIIRINRATETILRLPSERLVGRLAEEVFARDPEIREVIRECLASRRAKDAVETLLHREDGSVIPVEISLAPLEDPAREERGSGLVVLIRDLSEIQDLKEHIRRQDRLAALGELSAGIAHEIRNPLGIIKGAAGILHKEPVLKQTRCGELSAVILEEVDRLNDVITDFLEFARPRPPQFKPQDINDLIRGTLQMATLQIQKGRVRLHQDLAPDLPPVLADEHQMHQVFLNLILNALQATDEGDRVEISSRFVPQEKVVELVFADTGTGIPAENLDKVFNPFFTSREQGTGLGLSVVSKIVENHHGRIFLSSEEGRGTRFTIRLPVAERLQGAETG